MTSSSPSALHLDLPVSVMLLTVQSAQGADHLNLVVGRYLMRMKVSCVIHAASGFMQTVRGFRKLR